MKLGITGHRPHRLGGHDPENPVIRRIEHNLICILTSLKTHGYAVIGLTGMALGVDQAFARACLSTQTPYHAYIPLPEQPNRWPDSSRAVYRDLLTHAAQQHLTAAHVDSDQDVRRALLDRNSDIARDAQAAIAVWDGTPSGTADAVRKFRALGRPLFVLAPNASVTDEQIETWIRQLPPI